MRNEFRDVLIRGGWKRRPFRQRVVRMVNL